MIPPASFAVALAIIVFPHPGGPYNKTPTEKESNCCADIYSVTYKLF